LIVAFKKDGQPTSLLYLHLAAAFGPEVYNVSGLLVAAKPHDLCEAWASMNATGNIILAERGNCSFSDKAFTAQRAGAVGLVVGNNVNSDEYIRMGTASGTNVSALTIPSVFVVREDYLAMIGMIKGASNHTPVSARLDEEGAIDWDDAFWRWRPPSWILLVPMCTFFLCASLLLVKTCVIRRARQRYRQRRSATLPFVRYSNVDRVRPHNGAEPGVVANEPIAPLLASPNGTRAELPVTDHVIDLNGNADFAAPSPESPSQTQRLITPAAATSSSSEQKAPMPAVPSSGPSRWFQRRASNQQQDSHIHNDSCVICLEDFLDGEQLKMLPCHHGFHPGCIDPWLSERSDQCPICKMSIHTTEESGWLEQLCLGSSDRQHLAFLRQQRDHINA